MDHTCAEMIENLSREARRRGGRVILSGVRPGMFGTLQRAGVIDEVGPDAVFLHFDEVDGAGHRHGFHPKVAEYLRAIERSHVAVWHRERMLGPNASPVIALVGDGDPDALAEVAAREFAELGCADPPQLVTPA